MPHMQEGSMVGKVSHVCNCATARIFGAITHADPSFQGKLQRELQWSSRSGPMTTTATDLRNHRSSKGDLIVPKVDVDVNIRSAQLITHKGESHNLAD